MAGVARWCVRHSWSVIGLWLIALVVLGGISRTVGSAYNDNFNLPGTESTKALSLLQSAFPSQAGESDTIVVHVTSGKVTDPDVAQPVTAMLDRVASAPSVKGVTSPYSPAGARQISRDGRTAYATVSWPSFGNRNNKTDVKNVIAIAESARSDRIEVELGGASIQAVNQVSTNLSEFVGIIGAALVLLLAFGSFFSMLLPLIAAIFSLVAGSFAISLLSHGLQVNSISPIFATLIGLGVGVDYALFIVTRHRNGLKAGLSVEESIVRALNTSGRAVLFAGATVCIAMLGLLVLRLNFLAGLGVPSALMVLITVIAAVTLLPALLALRVRGRDVFRMRVLSRRERRRLATEGPHDEHASGPWARWSEFVSRRPRSLAALALALIAVLAIPFFSLRLGTGDQGNDPKGSTTRNAYDLLAAGFGPGFNGPLQLVATVPTDHDAQAFTQLATTVQAQPGVAAVTELPMRPGQQLGIMQVVPSTSPQDAATTDLINRLRSEVIPTAERGTTMHVYVGGMTAIFNDFSGVLSSKLPMFIGVIVVLGFILLLIAFRSIVVPLTAAVMNLLAAGASFGVVVAFFQFGWGSDAVGLGRPGPIDAFVPVLTLAVLFGLSMDYQVFLVSRMHEEWVHGRDNRTSVTTGQASTGRVITAAATIMILVFLAFVFGGQRVVAEFGVGLASAVLIDAFILRTVLVPALMHTFGRANWWLPRWIDKRLPHLSVEPPEDTVPDRASHEPVGVAR
ncbi:MAG TPA: MMPL family transporter [Micromonosporaceae bacterium]|nr:MMPL family transporter [Micromonosporaceae bacterium]